MSEVTLDRLNDALGDRYVVESKIGGFFTKICGWV